MTKPYTVDEVISRLEHPPKIGPRAIGELPRPNYALWENQTECLLPTQALMLAVESMKNHTTDEGIQIGYGLEQNGWVLVGHGFPESTNMTHVPEIIREFLPSTVLMQDEREWDIGPRDFRDAKARFTGVEELAKHPEIFKLTILKDSHQRPHYHMESAQRIGCHAWIIYYHPKIVKHLAPYVREDDLLRTYHTINPEHLPLGWRRVLCVAGLPYPQNSVLKEIADRYGEKGTIEEYAAIQNVRNDLVDRRITLHEAAAILFPPEKERSGVLLSGAVSGAYPLRKILFDKHKSLPQCTVMHHPGYHRKGCQTPSYLEALCKYKVAICTCSRYGYALRKIIEATACGCRVLTDLPVDEVLPEIDGNLVRIHPHMRVKEIAEVCKNMLDTYDHCLQIRYAVKAVERYDYRVETNRLSNLIENRRLNYERG